MEQVQKPSVTSASKSTTHQLLAGKGEYSLLSAVARCAVCKISQSPAVCLQGHVETC